MIAANNYKSHQYPESRLPLTPCNYRVHRCPQSYQNASHRILIMRLAGYGDIIMGSPVLAEIRRNIPDAHITWIVEKSQSDAIIANPYVDEIIIWDSMYWKKIKRNLRLDLWFYQTYKFLKSLKSKEYDIYISFQPEEWPWIANGLAAKLKIGIFDTFKQFYNSKETSSNTRYYTHYHTYKDLPEHRTDQYLLSLKHIGINHINPPQMQMGFTEDDKRNVENILINKGIDNSKPIIAIAPLTTWPTRCWPTIRYIDLCKRLAKNYQIILIGSPSEASIINDIYSQLQNDIINLSGILNFLEMAALISKAKILLSGDTGPMHVAAAVGTTYIALFSSTPAKGRAPLVGDGIIISHKVECGPCDQKICPVEGPGNMKCMDLITVDEVEKAIYNYIPVDTLSTK